MGTWHISQFQTDTKFVSSNITYYKQHVNLSKGAFTLGVSDSKFESPNNTMLTI
jgi:hypothetical protein